jgi:hypothetical protein
MMSDPVVIIAYDGPIPFFFASAIFSGVKAMSFAHCLPKNGPYHKEPSAILITVEASTAQ